MCSLYRNSFSFGKQAHSLIIIQQALHELPAAAKMRKEAKRKTKMWQSKLRKRKQGLREQDHSFLFDETASQPRVN